MTVADVPLRTGRNIKGRRYSTDEVDVVLAYVAATDSVYWISDAEHLAKSYVRLRLVPTTNGQRRGIVHAGSLVW